MCGIVSMISLTQGGFLHSDLEMMEGMMLCDTLRGADSTGMFTVMRDKSITTTKIGSHPLHLFTTPAWGKHRGKAIQNGRIMVAHNRKATTGAINSENAHPFHENNIVLVHNGMVRGGHKKLAETEVDSHAVCHAFNEKGAEEVLKTLDAAFAFVWYDIDKQRLFAVRNKERPLYLVRTADLAVLISEPWMATGILGRNNKKIVDVTEVEAGVLHEFTLNGVMATKKISLRVDPPVVIHQSTYSGYGPHWSRRDMAAWDGDDDIDDVVPLPSSRPALPAPVYHGVRKAIEETMAAGAPFASHADFQREDVILCRIHSCKVSPQGDKTQIFGQCIEPGKPQIDMVGFVPGKPTDRAVQDLFQRDLYATIAGFASSTCGPSLWVKDVMHAPMLETHMGDIDPKAWKYVVATCRCKECGNTIVDVDRPFTSVVKRATSEYRVTCADCIEHKLPKGEIRDSYNQRRLDALQDGVSVSEESPAVPVEPPKNESGATIH